MQSLTADGQLKWKTQLPVVNDNSVPDGFGGLLVTEHNTCDTGRTHPMTIVQLDPANGAESPGIFGTDSAFPTAGQTVEDSNASIADYCSFAYSALACLRTGTSGSASCHSVRKS